MKLTVRGHLLIGVLRRFYVAGMIWRVPDFPDTNFATDGNRTIARNGSLMTNPPAGSGKSGVFGGRFKTQ